MYAGRYDPFERGPRAVGAASFEANDAARDRLFPCQVWYPESARTPGPLIVFSHHSGGSRTASSFLCTHLASHGYVVAAMDHLLSGSERSIDGVGIDVWRGRRGRGYRRLSSRRRRSRKSRSAVLPASALAPSTGRRWASATAAELWV